MTAFLLPTIISRTGYLKFFCNHLTLKIKEGTGSSLFTGSFPRECYFDFLHEMKEKLKLYPASVSDSAFLFKVCCEV